MATTPPLTNSQTLLSSHPPVLMPPWEYHAYCRFMHLCVGQLLVSTLITMSIPMPYAGAVTNPSVTCHRAFDKYSSLGQQPVPRMVIHWWSPHEALWQWHCINNADQKVAIWHLECSFIWVMSLFVAGEDCYNSPSLSWRCHNVTSPGHKHHRWSLDPE